ncbi:hypothetical protein M434DRAFT_27534 [Hypoxylon sp. CO27-5]|nr:hypothetical protein M434DRAFT_27534 [Hypoxylon sp. CO27-5]
MESLANNRALSALEDVIKGEVELKLMNLSVDDMVHTILRRQDSQAIQSRLFGHLDGAKFSEMINAREDSHTIYIDLFKQVIAKMDSPSQTQHQHHSEAPSDCAYLTQNIPFTPQLSGMSAWAPMFMSEDEFYSIGFQWKKSDTIPKMQEVLDGLFAFRKFLNPPYLCIRAFHILSVAGEIDIYPNTLNTTQGVVKLWNVADHTGPGVNYNKYTADISKALSAFYCFTQYKNTSGLLTRNDQSPHSNETLENDLELKFFDEFARMECENFRSGPVQKSDKERWRNIAKFGGRLSSLLNDHGGRSFVFWFPLHELSTCIEEELVDTQSMDYLWEGIRGLLVKTGLGDFLKSLSTEADELLFSSLGIRQVSPLTAMDTLSPVFRMYSLGSTTETPPKVDIEILSCQPELSPLVYFGSYSGPVHLSAESSISPNSLLKLVDGLLDGDVMRHLLRQELPDDWCVLSRNETRQVADENMLLHDYRGIVIPLCLSHGWTFLFYANPMRCPDAYPLQFVDPNLCFGGDLSRFLEAKDLVSRWIPEDAAWVPRRVNEHEVKLASSQAASRLDSGIHVIVNAIAMAKTGEPESRALNARMCKAIRARYFVILLNDMRTAIEKATKKG